MVEDITGRLGGFYGVFVELDGVGALQRKVPVGENTSGSAEEP